MANEENDKTPPGAEANPSPKDKDEFQPLEKEPSFVESFETLLKRPGSIIVHLDKGSGKKIILSLLITAAVCFWIFGLLIGSFSMGSQLFIAPVKFLGGALFSALICLPSLYIFSCLSGFNTRFSFVVGVLVAALCLTALMLMGLAPVLWLFTQSTESVIFIGALILAFWLICLWFGLGVVTKAANFVGIKDQGHLKVWMLIFVVVTIQMSTSLRPLISAPEKDEGFFPDEKKFFLKHWIDEAEAASEDGQARRQKEAENE